MGQELFGYFSTTWLTMHLCFIVCYFGAHRLVIDFVTQNRDGDEDEYYRGIAGHLILSFTLCVFLVIGVYMFADLFAAFLQKPPVAGYMKILVWSAPFYCATTILLSATRGLKIMKLWVFVRNGLEPLWDLVALCIVFFGMGFLSAPFWAKATAFAMGAIVAAYYFSHYFSLRKIFRKSPTSRTWKRIFVFGLPVMLADFVSVVILKVDIIPLSVMVAAGEVAVFQVILNAGNIMRNIPQALDPIMMPIVVEMRKRNDISALEAIYTTVIRASLFLSFGFFIITAIFGDFILAIFSEQFVYAALPMTIVCFGIMLHTVFSTIEPVLVMSGYPYVNLFNNIFLVTVNMVIDIILIPKLGLLGAAIGSLTGCGLTALIQIAELYLILKIKPLRWDLLTIFVIGAAFFVIFKSIDFFGSSSWTLVIINLIIFTVLYLVVGWKWFLHDAERDLFGAIFRKKG